jgi:hypothetical protein
MTERRIAGARDGDVTFAHINQPGYAAGQGVAEGSVALRKPGFAFVLLKDAAEPAAQSLHSSVLDKWSHLLVHAGGFAPWLDHARLPIPRFRKGCRPGHETVPR